VIIRARVLAACLPIGFALSGCSLLGGGMAPAPEGAQYRCEAFAFDPGIVDQPGTAERNDDPRSLALRDHLLEPGEPHLLPETGWHLVGSDASQAEFIAKSDDGYTYVTLEPAEGRWIVTGWGGCNPALVMGGGTVAATWELAQEADVDATSTTIEVLVSERSCASGKPPDGRIVGPRIVIEASVIRIAFGITPLPGDQECPGSPPAHVVVDLGQPIGDRVLSDFGIWPPVNVWAE
jgi:hypothetical protein